MTKKSRLIGLTGDIGHGKDLTALLIREIAAIPTTATEGYYRQEVDPDCTIEDVLEEFVKRIRIYCDRSPLLPCEDIVRRCGEWIASENHQYEIKGFADTLKRMAAAYLEIDPARFEDRIFKEYHNPALGMTHRDFLRTLGADLRAADPDFWVRGLLQSSTTESHWIIKDTRYPNEADAISARDGVVLRVFNPRVQSDRSHLRDTALDGREFQTIVNDGSLEDLAREVVRALPWLLEPTNV